MSPYLGKAPYSENVVKNAAKDVKGIIKELDGSLKKSLFLTGDLVSIADISLGSELVLPFKLLIDENTRKGFKSVIEWLTRLFDNTAFRNYWGEFELCSKIAEVPNVQLKQEEHKKEPKQKGEKTKPKKEKIVNVEDQEKKQRERKEKKELAEKAKLEAELKKKAEEQNKPAEDANKEVVSESKTS